MSILDNKHQRKKVLLLAYACSPYSGSEPGLGWHWAIEIAKHFDTWVLCKKQKYEKDVRQFFTENGEIPGLYFVFVSRTRLEKFLKLTIPGIFYFVYNRWHRRAYREAANLHRTVNFDLIHQLNICTFREPGYLWQLDAPFVWGPVGGTQNYPWGFLISAGFWGLLQEGFRNVLNSLQRYYAPRARKAAKRADIVLAVNAQVRREMEKLYRIKPVVMLDGGSCAEEKSNCSSDSIRKPLRILWSGILEHRKALHLLIMALAKLPDSLEWELRILGDGSLKARWQRLSKKVKVDSHCTWIGWVPHDQAMTYFNWADLFVFTSLRENFGTVVLEALGSGIPVICLNHQGVGDVVTNECGIKIPVTRPDEVISRLRDAIIQLATDRKKLEILSQGAIDRSREYLWSTKGEKMAAIYETVLQKNG